MPRKEQCDGAADQAPYSILVVDDDEIIRRGISAIISDEPDFTVVGSAGDEPGAVQLLERHQPHLLLLDLSLGHRDGILFLKDIMGRFPDLRIIALSDETHGGYEARTLELGAAAHLSKSSSAAQLIDTVRAVVAAGDRPLRGRRRLAHCDKRVARAKASVPTIASLTDRELHVFRLIAAGLGTKHIAEELGLSRKTIESYREHIKLKLGYANAEALRKGALDWAHHSPAGSHDARKDRGNPR